jgi:hypothetical protein
LTAVMPGSFRSGKGAQVQDYLVQSVKAGTFIARQKIAVGIDGQRRSLLIVRSGLGSDTSVADGVRVSVEDEGAEVSLWIQFDL